MNTSRPTSSPCRYCRADNFENADQCWLCDARDWNPSSAAPMKGAPGRAESPSPRSEVDSRAMIGALGLTLLLVALGLGSDYLGLAVVVSVVWWITIGMTVARRGRFGTTDVALSFVRAIATSVILAALLVVTVVGILLSICLTSGPPNFH